MAYTTGDDNYGVTSYIVDPAGGNGNYTTIAAALSAASTASYTGTIFIRPGTYTENPALIAGVNLESFLGDAITDSVIILGKCTFSSAGKVCITGIELKTNSDYFLSVTGSSASSVFLNNCILTCSNNTGIQFSSSNASSQVNLFSCSGNIATSGIAIFSHSAAGSMNILGPGGFSNSGSSTTASTCSGTGVLNFTDFAMSSVLSLSSSSVGTFIQLQIDSSLTNTVCITTSGTVIYNTRYCNMSSGSAACYSIGSGSTLNTSNDVLSSTNTNPITGAGSVLIGPTTYSGSGTGANPTTYIGKNPGPSGTFTPGISFGGGTTGITYSNQQGNFVRIGNVVFVSGNINLTSKGSSTGNVLITGMPYALGSAININNFPIVTGVVTYTGTTYAYGSPSTTSLGIAAATTGIGSTNLTNTNFANNSAVSFTGFYLIA